MRIVTHTVAMQLLRAGHTVTIRHRREPLDLTPRAACIVSRRHWAGAALVLMDGLPTLVYVHMLEPGDRVTVTLTHSGRIGGLDYVPWERVLGLGREWIVQDFIW